MVRKQMQESSSQKKLTQSVPFTNMYNNEKLKYIIINGNNSKLIRESMKRRPWWIEIPKFNSIYNFKWQPVSYGIRFPELQEGNSIKQIVNHLECHATLSEKSLLYETMKTYCESMKQNIFDIMPVTFLIEVESLKPHVVNTAILPFLQNYNILEEHK